MYADVREEQGLDGEGLEELQRLERHPLRSVQVQQDALLVVDRQMSYMRQQLSARMLSRYQNNYHFGGSTL